MLRPLLHLQRVPRDKRRKMAKDQELLEERSGHPEEGHRGNFNQRIKSSITHDHRYRVKFQRVAHPRQLVARLLGFLPYFHEGKLSREQAVLLLGVVVVRAQMSPLQIQNRLLLKQRPSLQAPHSLLQMEEEEELFRL